MKQKILLSELVWNVPARSLKEADLILLVLNFNEELTEEDEKLFEAVKGMDVIVIVNKTDLEAKNYI